jgi:hypothetical protein
MRLTILTKGKNIENRYFFLGSFTKSMPDLTRNKGWKKQIERIAPPDRTPKPLEVFVCV